MASPDHQRTDPSKQWHTCPHKYQSPQPRFPHRHAAMPPCMYNACTHAKHAHKPARSSLVLPQQRTELPHGQATARQCWPGCHKVVLAWLPNSGGDDWHTLPACVSPLPAVYRWRPDGAISMQHNKQHAGVAGLVGDCVPQHGLLVDDALVMVDGSCTRTTQQSSLPGCAATGRLKEPSSGSVQKHCHSADTLLHSSPNPASTVLELNNAPGV